MVNYYKTHGPTASPCIGTKKGFRGLTALLVIQGSTWGPVTRRMAYHRVFRTSSIFKLKKYIHNFVQKMSVHVYIFAIITHQYITTYISSSTYIIILWVGSVVPY